MLHLFIYISSCHSIKGLKVGVISQPIIQHQFTSFCGIGDWWEMAINRPTHKVTSHAYTTTNLNTIIQPKTNSICSVLVRKINNSFWSEYGFCQFELLVWIIIMEKTNNVYIAILSLVPFDRSVYECQCHSHNTHCTDK